MTQAQQPAASRPNLTHLYTDGSYKTKSGNGGWGLVLVYDDGSWHDDGFWAKPGEGKTGTTNNRMEMMAVIAAFKTIVLHFQNSLCAESVAVMCDSDYVVQGLLKRAARWKAQGWKNHEDKVIANVDLWQILYAHWEVLVGLKENGLNANIFWIKSHNDDFWNDRADAIAKQMANRLDYFEAEEGLNRMKAYKENLQFRQHVWLPRPCWATAEKQIPRERPQVESELPAPTPVPVEVGSPVS